MAGKAQAYMEKFAMGASKIAQQIHIKSLRDAFATIMPVFILAGLAVLINNVIFANVLQGDALQSANYWGNVIVNGTLNIAGLLIAPMIAYFLAKNKGFENPISAAVIAISALIIFMPYQIDAIVAGTEKDTVAVTGAILFNNVGVKAMFSGIIVGLAGTEFFMFLSNRKRLRVNLGDQVPKAVGDSFTTLIPSLLALSVFGLISALLAIFFQTDLVSLIADFVQAPLKNLGTTLLGVIIIYTVGNLLFTQGIHQAVVTQSILDPLMLIAMTENITAYAAGEAIPNIFNTSFVNIYGLIGGSGCTISLLIATFIFSKSHAAKDICKLGGVPSLFNINEPIIFGYPIVFNYVLIIPFILMPTIGFIIGYFATEWGLMSYCVTLVPWTTPPILNAFLATAGDWRAVVVQLIIIAIGVFVYLPFMKAGERAQAKLMEEQKKAEEEAKAKALAEEKAELLEAAEEELKAEKQAEKESKEKEAKKKEKAKKS